MNCFAASSGAVLLAVFCMASTIATAGPLQLRSDTEVASAGYFTLSWDGVGPSVFELRETERSGSSRIAYHGPDTARLVSGKPDGVYRYEVRPMGEVTWSEPVTVSVNHHPLSRALGFFAVGALVFVATTAMIVVVARRA